MRLNTMITIILWAACLSATAAERAGINGRVVDRKTGESLPGANVRVLGTPWGAATDADGRFRMPQIPSGTYSIEVSVIGYEPQRLIEQKLHADESLELEFGLTEKVIQLQDVVVTPGHFAIMRDVPEVRQTLSRQDIQNLPQFGEDIYRAIKRLPGIASNDFSAGFNVRGGESNEVLVMLDGLELYEPFHLKDVNGGALSIIDVQAIGGIDMITGGFPAQYGDRLSGVFNINSARPTQQRTAVGLSFSNARFMSEGAFNGGKGSWLVSARRGYLDLVMEIVDPESQFRPVYYDLLGKVQYQFGGSQTFSLNLLRARDDLNLNEDGDIVETGYGNSYGWATLNSMLTERLLVQTVLSTGRVSTEREGTDHLSNSGVIRAQVRDRRHFDVYGLKQDWSFDLASRTFLKWGVEYKRLTSSYDYFNAIGTVTPVDANHSLVEYDTLTAQLAPAGHELRLHLANRLRLFDPLTLEIGLRYDYNSYTADEHFSPRFNLAYALGERTALRLGWGKFYQSQRIHELYVPDGDQQFYGAELAEHRVIGLEHQLANGIQLRVEGYQKPLSHLRPKYYSLKGDVEFFPEVEPDRYHVEPESGNAKGVELFFKKDGGGKLDWWASYAYAFAQDQIDGATVRRNFDQRHTVYVDLAYRPSPRWRLNFAWQYHSGWPYTEATFEKVVLDDGAFYYRKVYGELNAAQYPAYHRADVKVSRHFPLGTGKLVAFVEVTNLFNHFNVRNYYYEDQRQPNGDFTFIRQAESWFPRLPSIGISWEF